MEGRLGPEARVVAVVLPLGGTAAGEQGESEPDKSHCAKSEQQFTQSAKPTRSHIDRAQPGDPKME